jgi:16S rRNA processing protein RimM
MEKSKFLEAGEIVSTHGVRGEVKILPWTDSVEFLRRFKTLYIGGAPYRVLHSFAHKGCMIAALEGIGDVGAAMALKGRTVCFARADARLPEGSFFLADVLGARVVTETGEDVGELVDIIENPTQNVYVVRGEREHLIPAVPEFIRSTDTENGVVTVRLIEGM